jgi:hypothetical protein
MWRSSSVNLSSSLASCSTQPQQQQVKVGSQAQAAWRLDGIYRGHSNATPPPPLLLLLLLLLWPAEQTIAAVSSCVRLQQRLVLLSLLNGL